MDKSRNDSSGANVNKIRELAKRYAEIAFDGRCAERVERYRKLNSLKQVRPPVLVFEIPWGEFSDCDELRCSFEESRYRSLEWQFKSVLYQWKHFQGDYAVHPYYRVGAAVKNTGVGVEPKEKIIKSITGTNIMSHQFEDIMSDEEALERVKFPDITYDREATDRAVQYYSELFDGIMPVKKSGVQLYFASWDFIVRLRDVDNCLVDMYDRPEFVHKIIDKFTRIHEYELDCYEKLNVLDTDPYYLHCTPACTYELPVKNMDTDVIKASDVWCRAMAQAFAVVSPKMLDEFDLQYTKRLFDRCGLAYYGCCEPLDAKIEKLRQFKNLRRISITPWANVDNAADKIGGDYVLSYKSNPAFVAGKVFDSAPVIAETKRVLEACRRNGTPCEFILKDISTISNNPENITKWVETVNGVIDNYF